MTSTVADVPAAIEAELNYLLPDGKRQVYYAFEPPPGVPHYTGTPSLQKVVIHNARTGAADAFALDKTGFERTSHTSALADFSDEEAIRNVYYPESEALIKRLTGAEKVAIFDHTIRDSASGARYQVLREPARYVHNDQTFLSAPRRVRDHLQPEEAERRLKQPFAIINLWRPLGTVEAFPLAICDARTIAPEDLIPRDLVYRDKVGETYSFAFNPRHVWYYYPRLQPDEALLLKIYDSREDGRARLTAHTAFEDPSSATDAAPRRSIELRMLVFFDAQH